MKVVKIIGSWVNRIIAALALLGTSILFLTLLVGLRNFGPAMLPWRWDVPEMISQFLLPLLGWVYGGIIFGIAFGLYRGLIWAWKLVEKAIKPGSKRIALVFLATALLLVALISFGTPILGFFAGRLTLAHYQLPLLILHGGCLSGACLALNWVWAELRRWET